jgi:hypothetical protein
VKAMVSVEDVCNVSTVVDVSDVVTYVNTIGESWCLYLCIYSIVQV